MIICPKCHSHAEFSMWHQEYRCLNNNCDWSLSPTQTTDEDRLRLNKQEKYERWELDDPVGDYACVYNGYDVIWKSEDKFDFISKDEFIRAVLKLIWKDRKMNGRYQK